MKYVKMLGPLAIAAAALMAFVGSASATTLTSPTGTVLPNGTKVKASSTHTQIHGTLGLTCKKTSFEGEITALHHVKGKITALSFSECGTDTVSPIPKAGGGFGEWTINSKGEITWIDVRVTAFTHRTVFGIPITTHCIYNTGAGTLIGTLDDSTKTGTNATMTISDETGGKPIPQEETDPSCKDDAIWTGDYTVTSPNPLYVD